MKTILVTNNLTNEFFDHLRTNYQIEIWSKDEAMPYEMILEKVATGQVIGIVCSSGDQIDRVVLEAAPVGTLKVVSTVSVGFDHIDLGVCRQRGIAVGYTPNVLTDAVAELAIGLLLATARRLIEANRMVLSNRWPAAWSNFYQMAGQIKGATVGVVGGAGRVGQAIIDRLAAFRPGRLLYSDVIRLQEMEDKLGATFKSLEELLQMSDYVILAVSLNEKTFHLIGARQLGLMKSTAILINISRGQVIDQPALVEALRKNQIRAAGLDVLEEEPIKWNDPLLKLDNVIILPHIGSATLETRTAIIQLAIANLEAGLDNRILPAHVPL